MEVCSLSFGALWERWNTSRRRGRLLRRENRHALIARAHRCRSRREIQRRAAFVGAAAGDHEPVAAGDDVPLAKRRIVFDSDRGQTNLILAVAGATRDQLVAVAKGVGQFGIGLSALGRGSVDAAAVNDLGVTGRAKTVARGRPALTVGCRYREIAAVTSAHAKGLPTAGIAGTRTRVAWRSDGAALVDKRQPDGRGLRSAAAERAEQRGEKIFGLRARSQ